MRYEIKLVGSEFDLQRVRAELRSLPAALRTLHPPRIVQSIYFDTHEGRAVEENLAGISKRRKLRMRWYGDSTKAVSAQFECKIRESSLGTKQVHILTEPIDVAGRRRRQFVRDLCSRLPAAMATALDGHEPAQWIRYHREYLSSQDRSLRVTVDHDLRAFDQRTVSKLSCRQQTPLPKLLIIEIKADEAARDSIERCLQGIDLPPSKCSKFVIASAPDEAPLPSAYM